MKAEKKERKEAYFRKLRSFMNDFSKCVVIGIDNVQSRQMQDVRIALRGRAELLMGKNTMIRCCLREMAEERPEIEELLQSVVGNIGFCFTNADVLEIKDVLEEYKVQSAAKAGIVAPVNVVIPGGVTGLGPEKTSFFQALNLPTKIFKGQIEMLSDVTVVSEGAKVGLSEAKLLNMMNISPFWYNCTVKMILDGKSVYPPAVLEITMDSIRARILEVAHTKVAPVSLAIALPNPASVPHMIMTAFKNALAVAVATEITFKEAEKVKAFLENPEAFLAAAGGDGGDGGAAPAEEKKEAAPEPEPESDSEGEEMSLFD